MKLQNKIIDPSSRLCSLHFEEKFIDRTSVACVRLKENAIPHVSTLNIKLTSISIKVEMR